MQKKLFFFLLTMAYHAILHTQSLFLDGFFSDWQLRSDYLSEDPAGDGRFAGPDFLAINATEDSDYLYLYVELQAVINLQDNNQIRLLIDWDNNTATGSMTEGLGADIIYNLGQRKGTFHFPGGGMREIFHDDLQLISLPTHTSRVFELSMRKSLHIGGLTYPVGDTIRLVWQDGTNGDRAPDLGQFLVFPTNKIRVSGEKAFSIQKQSNHFLRVLSYNVERDNISNPGLKPAFSRILGAVRPDVVGFQEIYNSSEIQIHDLMDDLVPSDSGQVWHVAKVEPDIFLVSHFAILQSATVRGGGSSSSGNGAFLLEVPQSPTGQLFCMVAHLPCCDNDLNRQLEVDALMAFLREAKEGRGPIPLKPQTPIIIMGDMNLVGDFRQLQTFLEGNIVNENIAGEDFAPDWDGTYLEESNAFVTGQPLAVTWWNDDSSFGPGKLDFQFFSGSLLENKNSYSLQTRFLPADTLDRYRLNAGDINLASDHFPLVVDYDWKLVSRTKDGRTGKLEKLRIFPNPAQSVLGFSLADLRDDHPCVIRIFDQSGLLVGSPSVYFSKEQSIVADVSINHLLPGIYFLSVQNGHEFYGEKFFVERSR